MIQGLVVDVDGTLVDSNQAHALAFEQAFYRYGYRIPAARVLPLIGMGGKILISKLIGEKEYEDVVKRISEEHGKIFKNQFLPHIQAFDQTRELIEEIKSLGIQCCIGSSAKAEELETLLKIARVNDLIPLRVSATDVHCPKPHGDIVEAAVEKMGLKAHQCLMLGDTPYDIQSAQKARVDTIALTCGGWNRNQLSGAIAIYENPRDLLARLQASPLINHFTP